MRYLVLTMNRNFEVQSFRTSVLKYLSISRALVSGEAFPKTLEFQRSAIRGNGDILFRSQSRSWVVFIVFWYLQIIWSLSPLFWINNYKFVSCICLWGVIPIVLLVSNHNLIRVFVSIWTKNNFNYVSRYKKEFKYYKRV